MQGKLIVIEGTDCSGKSTQFRLLCSTLEKQGVAFTHQTFPRYDSDSSALVRMYLSGVFGEKPDDVNAYAASSFYAVDRYASYKAEWEKQYLDGELILCDRYTTSNAIHQASKLQGTERERFLDWLFHYEYDLLGIPKPSAVLFIDMPPEYAVQLLKKREGKTEDIHERDLDYLARCYETASQIARIRGWHHIRCVENGAIRSIKDIHTEILHAVGDVLRQTQIKLG